MIVEKRICNLCGRELQDDEPVEFGFFLQIGSVTYGVHVEPSDEIEDYCEDCTKRIVAEGGRV